MIAARFVVQQFFPKYLWIFQIPGHGGAMFAAIVALSPIIVVILIAMIPIIITNVFRILEYNRRCREGLCTSCGYDLRASSEKCPECGKAIPLYRTSSR
jgi:hypothetical protein